jgi:transcriptional regulator with XRE-family HTH domain
MATHPLIAALRAERERQGIDRAEIARRIGYSHWTLGNWEDGLHAPSLDRFEDYATALGYQLTLTPRRTA